MGAAGYALTSLHVEEAGPIQGSLAFAVTNTVGAMFTLVGIAIVYGRTGALNLAQIGVALTSRPADHLVAIAFTLVAIGFLVKGALVPFHFWLSHAHAVAPSPVCLLLSGVMCELGAYAVARIYWTGFAGALPADRAPVVETLLVLGVGTALVGGAMALLERHLKRLLAFSTISYMGVFLTGVALLDRDGLAGALLAMLAHGFAKAALFLIAGVLLYRYGSVDELELHGRGRHDRLPMAIFAIALVALAAPPLVGTFAGKSLIDDSAAAAGHPFVAPLLTVAALLSTAAIARAGARIFFGVGPREDPMLSPQPVERSEIADEPRRPAALMTLPALLLALLAVALPLVPGLEELARHAATVFEDQKGTVAHVLGGRPGGALPPRAGGLPDVTAAGVVYGLIASLGGLLLAAATLGHGTIGRGVRRVAGRVLQPLRAIHTGHLGDDIAWAVAGAAALTAALAIGLD